MPIHTRFAVASVFAIALAVVALNLTPSDGVRVDAMFSRPAALAASPSPSPGAVLLPMPDTDTPLAAGSYYIADSGITNAQRMTFTVPEGWSTWQGFLNKHKDQAGEVMLVTWVVTHIFTDGCHHETLVSAGTTKEELVTALAAQKGRTAAAPVDATVGGFPARMIELTVAPNLDITECTNEVLRFWPEAGPDLSGGLCCGSVGNIDDVYAVDIAGRRLAVVVRHYPGSTDADKAELQGLLDSIQFEPLPTIAAPSEVASPEASGTTEVPSPSGS